MKNKEEPSIDLSRGNPCLPVDQNITGRESLQTTGSTIRTDGAATASIEKPALSLIGEPLMAPVVEPSRIEHRHVRFDHADKRKLLRRTA